MEIVVCVKRVPQIQEVDLEIEGGGKDVKKDMLAYAINEWDNYAIEEAVVLKEKLGGSVTAITLGGEDDEEVLRRCLAMGADRAIRVEAGDLELDGYVVSRVLAEVIRGLDHDLVLTGVLSDDDNLGIVGNMLAEHLGVSHGSVVTGVDVEGERLKVRMELEGGIDEVSGIPLPALLTIQTGINEPRYVSIMGIRKAAKKELKVMGVEELSISAEDLSPWSVVEEMSLPPEIEGAEMIEGDAGTVAEALLRIMKEKGVSV